MNSENLVRALKEKKLILGSSRTLKLLKTGRLNEIFLSSNCPLRLKEEIKHLAIISNIKVTELKETNEEFGAMCKKSFSISMACF